MNDVPSIARQARANLAQALNALQEDNVPPNTQALASVVAEAMNLLHRIEKNYDNPEFDRGDHATRALLLVRNALNSLQAPEHSHPTTESVLEPAARAVGLVHQLNQVSAARESDPPKSEAMAPTDPAPASHPKTPAVQTDVVTPNAPAGVDDASPTTAADTPNAGVTAHASDSVAPNSARSASPPSDSPTNDPENNGASAATVSVPAATLDPGTVGQQDRPSAIPERISTNPVALPALDSLPGEVYIEVALGAYSTSNFYKYVRDADIVDSGGLFVASYTPPELSQNVRIRATLSGGFEFEGRGTVDWRREMPKSGSLNPLTPPGFGVKFTELSGEARKMVLRYSRAREPFIREAESAT